MSDSELARVTGIQPRNQVNSICNRLNRSGVLLRERGESGEIVNVLIASAVPSGSQHESLPQRGPAGSSAEQQAAEAIMLGLLGEQLGVELAPRKLNHQSGARVELDGADPDLTVLVECWAHQGPAKVAQKYKLMNDATKLGWVAGTLPKRPGRLILCVTDEAAVKHLRGKSWQGQAIAALGVEIAVVTLPPEIVDAIATAQTRQYR
jgi:hypothetical protein